MLWFVSGPKLLKEQRKFTQGVVLGWRIFPEHAQFFQGNLYFLEFPVGLQIFQLVIPLLVAAFEITAVFIDSS